MPKIFTRKQTLLVLLGMLIMLALLLPSCYSVRLVNIHGAAEEDLANEMEGFHRHKKIHIIDTVVSLNLTQGEFMSLEGCASGGFHSVEYRVTLGHILLSGITLGRKRKMKVIYTCLLDESEFE